MSSEALTWPDNRPVYDIPSQAEFLVAPVTTLSPDDPVVQMLKAGSNAEVRLKAWSNQCRSWFGLINRLTLKCRLMHT